MTTQNERIVSGMRPTGPLHLGHHFGVLANWLELQEKHECFFFVADWHALTTEYADPKRIKGFVPGLVLDWVAAGLDPEKCVIFQQSQVKEHAELHLLMSMLTPVGWLERCPTYKEVAQELSGQKDLATYGFLGYPVLMCSDIILYKATAVPVGQDQLPHLELTREIARRFNFLNCPENAPFFPEPKALLTEEAKAPRTRRPQDEQELRQLHLAWRTAFRDRAEDQDHADGQEPPAPRRSRRPRGLQPVPVPQAHDRT